MRSCSAISDKNVCKFFFAGDTNRLSEKQILREQVGLHKLKVEKLLSIYQHIPIARRVHLNGLGSC